MRLESSVLMKIVDSWYTLLRLQNILRPQLRPGENCWDMLKILRHSRLSKQSVKSLNQELSRVLVLALTSFFYALYSWNLFSIESQFWSRLVSSVETSMPNLTFNCQESWSRQRYHIEKVLVSVSASFFTLSILSWDSQSRSQLVSSHKCQKLHA